MMTIAIGILMLFCYLLVSTEHINNINKAATAMFAGVVGWILFMCTGTEYISTIHGAEFTEYLAGAEADWEHVHQFIANNVFMRHSVYICSLVMYLLATMAIVDVLGSNECFDFIKGWIRHRSSQRVLWISCLIAFLLSANLDNLTTTMLMLLILKKVVADDKQRLWIGAAVLIAANGGGCLTVIGDITSLMVWAKGAVTPANFSGSLVLPTLVAVLVPIGLISRRLPQSIDLVRPTVIFRGDDNVLPLWQRIVLLVIGMGGLWFVPTFHRITLLPPFLGALCVLCFLWVLNEIFNRKRIRTEQPSIVRGSDHRLLYETLQVIMFLVGMCLAVSVLIECGAMQGLHDWAENLVPNIYIFSVIMGFLSALMDNVALVLTGINVYDIIPAEAVSDAHSSLFAQNGAYWHLIIYCGIVGGLLLPIGNTAGYALMRSEDMDMWWYVKHITGKVLIGWALGLAVYFLMA